MKSFLLNLFLICGCIVANAEIIDIANYTDESGAEKCVKLFLKNNKASSVIIQCEQEDGAVGYLIQPINYLFALENYLNEIKDKYNKWTQTAISNEIGYYEKEFPASGYQYGFMWYNPEQRQGTSELNAIWEYSKENNVVVVSAKVVDTLGSNEITNFRFVFTCPKDIEALLTAISQENIKSHTPVTTDSLFD